MCEFRHVLSVKNHSDLPEISVSHSLVLIHGVVSEICDIKEVILKVEELGLKFTFLLDNGGEFKFLFELPSPGLYSCHLQYCKSSLKLRIRLLENENPLTVCPIYLVCSGHDGAFQGEGDDSKRSTEEACKRIDLGLKLVQLIIAEKLNESSFGRRTFRISSKCQVFHSELEKEESYRMSGVQLWNYFADELIKREENHVKSRKYVAFIGCTTFKGISNEDFSYENIKRNTLANAAIGGGGLALFGTGCFYTWPNETNNILDSFKNERKVDLENLMDDSNYRRTFGGCFATNIGSLCHELGHVFDLGHTEDGIMGKSLDNVDQMFLVKNSQKFKMPKRNVQMPGSNSRLTRIKKSGSILEDYRMEKECNGIYFSRNCSVILAFNKWLQIIGKTQLKDLDSKLKNKISIEPETKEVRSPLNPLKLVEIRELTSEMVIKYWEFEEEIHEFQVPKSVHWSGKEKILFAIDSLGTTCKENIQL